MEEYGTARQATNDNIIWRMCIACWITKATDTLSGYVILLFTAKFVVHVHFSITLHVHCLSCF